jgi:hypothetical protein
MKRFSVLILVMVVPLMLLAQQEPGFNKMSLGANIEVSLPAGDFSNLAGTGFGGNAKFQYGTNFRAAFTATLGYLSWGSKDFGTGGSIKPSTFSFLVGGKYYFADGIYGSLEGGVYFVSYTYERVVAAEGNTSRFMMPIGVGYQKSGFEVAARYFMFHTDFNNFSFTVGYNFML